MKTLLALFGWKYVKDVSNGKYHYYKCQHLQGAHNRGTYNKARMQQDLERHPYSLGVAKCLEELV